MLQPGRNYEAGTSYRYGFNGKENDNEVKGEGNQQDYGMRIYDPRLGRFLSVDPLTKKYPELTPYQFASNSPIFGIDKDGEENSQNLWLFDIWMDFKFGDPTGGKTLMQGIVEKTRVENGDVTYHNSNVPQRIQNILDQKNINEANAKIVTGTVKFIQFNVETSAQTVSMFVPTGEITEFAAEGLSKIWRTLLTKEGAELDEAALQGTLSPKAREFYRQGKFREALDTHYEDLVRKETGGTQKIIDGAEYDAVTNKAIIQAKRSLTAVERPKNFLSKATRAQIKRTIALAKSQGKEAQFWFKYGVHKEVRKYIEDKGGKVILGLNKN